jgi:hypothetical protein
MVRLAMDRVCLLEVRAFVFSRKMWFMKTSYFHSGFLYQVLKCVDLCAFFVQFVLLCGFFWLLLFAV